MARLPNNAQAIIDVRKIADYCLNPVHPRGRHKARMFREALELGRSDSDWLREVLLAAVRDSEAIETDVDEFGSRWRVDVWVARHGKGIMVRTVWIVRTGETMPRFVTCWIL